MRTHALRFGLRLSALSVLAAAVTAAPAGHAAVASAAEDTFLVRTSAGTLRGIPRPGGGAQFLGIPYAQPPVGDLRWHEPLPAKPWQGVRDANAYGAPCAQPVLGDWNRHDAENSSEDCLYLNVTVPAWPVKGPLPVMFWIHGGANQGGAGVGALYNDGTLAGHGVVLVTINYRLGVFGFLAHPALTRESAHGASGNYGLMDQILALRWVRENIAKLGGDPKNITVFGQSAGAQDTGMLMVSNAKDLFQKAIAQSGSPLSPPARPLAEAERSGEQLAAALKAPAGKDAIAFLRSLPAKELLGDLGKLDDRDRPQIGPDIDGWVIRRSPAEVLASGEESAIPLLFGTTTREFGSEVMFGAGASPDAWRAMIQRVAGNLAPKVLAVYGLDGGGQGTKDPKYGSAGDQFAADVIFRCSATTQGIWHVATHHPTYEYELDHAIPGQEFAVHSGDLPYVFGYFPTTGNIGGNFGEVDKKLAYLVQTYWTNFAKTGDPNGDKLPEWPIMGATQQYIQFTQDGEVRTATGLRAAQCDAFREYLTESIKHKN